MLKLHFLLLLLGASLCVGAQRIIIENGSTGEPAFNVAIYNQDKSHSTLTDLNGCANIKDFNQSDTLCFQHPSFLRLSLPFNEVVHLKKIVLTRKNILIPEFVISASKHRENQQDIAYMVDVLSPKTMELLPAKNSADILSATGNIFVQKSQAGGGSPVLRGFEANKVLLVVDGLRMNNAIYRGGHLQNSLTIDNAILERAEIIYGPSSVIYGSDALGGVVHYITRDPELSDSAKTTAFSLNASSQAGTAASAFKQHLDFNLGRKKISSLTSITYGKFGDIRIGAVRPPYLDNDWGMQKWYVERINRVDTKLVNNDTLKVLKAGYTQIDALQKFRYKVNRNVDFVLNMQYSESTDINRQDQLNNFEGGLPEYAEWYYGPQKRFLTSLKTTINSNNKLFNSVVSTIGYQKIEESRHTRLFMDDTLYNQTETVQVLSANFDFIKFLYKKSRLNYGLELNYNDVASVANMQNIVDQSELPYLTRYPDEGTQTYNAGAYASYKTNLGKKWKTSFGGRVQYYSLQSEYGDATYGLPDIFQNIDLNNASLTGAVSLIYKHSDFFNGNFIASTGYRSPNLDDLAKIRVTSGKLTLPNADLEPEHTYNAEFGLSKTFDGYIQLNGKYFFTYMNNAIVSQAYTFEDGSDSLYFQGSYKSTYMNHNASEAIMHGFHVDMVSDLNTNVSIKGTLNYTYGHNITDDEPMAHIPPIFGRANITYEQKRFMGEVYFEYAGWKRIEDMVTSSEDKISEATEYGFPSWYTINLNSYYVLSPTVTFQLAVENLTDNFYKPFASGVPAPGINFVGTLRLKL